MNYRYKKYVFWGELLMPHKCIYLQQNEISGFRSVDFGIRILTIGFFRTRPS